VSADVQFQTHSREETVAAGRRLAAFLQPGDIVILTGDLGAGKTALSSGVIAGLGSTDQVTSPTFTIMRHHNLPGGGQVLHLDAYRLQSPDDAEDIGLLELLDGGAIAIIEWGERIDAALGSDLLYVLMTHDEVSGIDSDEVNDVRLLEVRGRGERWASVDLARAFAC
jgi:tRNA threonylcarbamoyladenosine biosynthesis protein TsaE